MIGLLEALGLAFVPLALATWLAVALLAPSEAGGGEPERRLTVARAWLLAPLWLPALLLASAMAPDIAAAILRSADHCETVGAGHHHHLCVVHPPHAAEGPLGWFVALAVLLPVAGLLGVALRRAGAEWRLGSALIALSRPSGLGDDVRLLDRDDPIALTVGWWRPTVLLSDGLLRRLSTRGRDVVLAHERAHVARGDSRIASLERLAAALLPQVVARPLLAQIDLAREQACDAVAARSAGGPLAVATTLAEVLRLGVRALPVGVSVASSAIEARVAHLLDPAPPSWAWRLGLAALGLAVVAAGMGPGHAAIERLVNVLLH